MPPAAPQPDPRREHLRRQAVRRREAVLERLATTRSTLIAGAIVGTGALAAFIDVVAPAHAHASSTTGSTSASSSSAAYGGSSGSASQGSDGSGSTPSASSGGGVVVSGGS